MEITTEFAHLSPRQFAEQVTESIYKQHGVDLRRIFENDALSPQQKLHLARTRLAEALISSLQESGESIDAADTEFDEKLSISQFFDANVDVEPNLSFTAENAAVIMNYKGDDVREYMYTLTKRMENMQNAKTPGQLAVELVAGGLLSIGIPMAIATVQALRAGQALLAAVRAGITSIGMKTAVLAVVTVLVGFLLYLFLENPKKVLGMVINGTKKNLVVRNWERGLDGGQDSDLFMAFGHMASFPKDFEEGVSSPQVQVRAMISFGANDPDNIYFGGVYFADRNFGLRGAEGAMILTSTDGQLRFGHLFACPYFEDNGTAVSMARPGQTSKQFYDEHYPRRAVSVQNGAPGYRMRANVNNARGGVVACIASITEEAS